MRKRIRELTALVLAVCMICGGIWIGKSAAYAAEVGGNVYTITWEDEDWPESDYSDGYTVETYGEYTLNGIYENDAFDIPEDPTKPGYVFLGWNGYKGGIEEPYLGNYIKHADGTWILNKIDNYTASDNRLTVYGYWRAFRYEISYAGEENASGIPETVHGSNDSPIYYQQEVILSEEIPIRSGYTFSGWEYNGTVYPPGGTFIVPDAPYEEIMNEDGDIIDYVAYLTLTAAWTPNQHTITYNGNGASSGVPAAQETGYETVVTAAASPVREGYTFTGWLSSDGQVYLAGETFTMPDSDVTLTAQWEIANSGGISAAGSYYLLRGQPYSLNGVMKVEGEKGQYASGATFYVPSDGYYNFVE